MLAQTNSELGRYRMGYRDEMKDHRNIDLGKDPFYREGIRDAKLQKLSTRK